MRNLTRRWWTLKREGEKVRWHGRALRGTVRIARNHDSVLHEIKMESAIEQQDRSAPNRIEAALQKIAADAPSEAKPYSTGDLIPQRGAAHRPKVADPIVRDSGTSQGKNGYDPDEFNDHYC